MSRQPKIKWREQDLKELARVVKNFNAKLNRIEKKNPENMKYMPKFSKTIYDEDLGGEAIIFTDRLSVNQMKELIQTRQDFNREINALKRFSVRGAEQIVNIPDTYNNIKTTTWQRTELNRRQVIINKARKKKLEEIESIELQEDGKKLGYTLGNLDATVLAQAPKLAPHIPMMKENIARVLGVSVEAVNVKATTEEHLGFTGSGDGMAAHAVCLLL